MSGATDESAEEMEMLPRERGALRPMDMVAKLVPSRGAPPGMPGVTRYSISGQSVENVARSFFAAAVKLERRSEGIFSQPDISAHISFATASRGGIIPRKSPPGLVRGPARFALYSTMAAWRGPG